MRIRKRWFIVGGVAVIGIFMMLGLQKNAAKAPAIAVEPSTVATGITWKDYASSTIGLEFKYPDKYVLKELPSSQGIAAIILTKSSANLSASSTPFIRIDIFQNPDNLTADQWARQIRASNFEQSNGLISSTTISGSEGVAYRLAKGPAADESVVAKSSHAFAFVVYYSDPADPIRLDYGRILDTVKLK